MPCTASRRNGHGGTATTNAGTVDLGRWVLTAAGYAHPKWTGPGADEQLDQVASTSTE
jgi:hypothetical protein